MLKVQKCIVAEHLQSNFVVQFKLTTSFISFGIMSSKTHLFVIVVI
jgi:hypothetical protein